MAVIEERVILLLFHLEPTFCPLDGLPSRVPTHGVLHPTGSLQVGEFHLLQTNPLLGVRDKIDGIFEGKEHESAAEGWPIGSDGGKVEDVVSLG
jgi:hypothetical protein